MNKITPPILLRFKKEFPKKILIKSIISFDSNGNNIYLYMYYLYIYYPFCFIVFQKFKFSFFIFIYYFIYFIVLFIYLIIRIIRKKVNFNDFFYFIIFEYIYIKK